MTKASAPRAGLGVYARARLTNTKIRGVKVLTPHRSYRPMNRTITAFRPQGNDGRGDLAEKPVARMRRQRPARVHDGGQFGIGKGDRR